MKHDRTIVGYHGCDEQVAQALLMHTTDFEESDNDYDWLGRGVYFWEYGPARALQFAQDQQKRRKVKKPAVVGALLQLGNCFDLMDTGFTAKLSEAHKAYEVVASASGPLPVNELGEEKLLRKLDCAVINWYLDLVESRPKTETKYDSVRCGFVEGPAAFTGSNIRQQSHVQIAIRNPSCILGIFKPKM